MASFEINMVGEDTLLKMLTSLENSDQTHPRIINAAAGPLESALKAESNRHMRTGAMAGSIKATDAKKAPKSGDYYTVVRATGKDNQSIGPDGKQRTRKKAVRNMAKMAYIQYGTSRMGQDPIIERAVQSSRNDVLAAMQSEYNKILSEGGG